MGTLHCCQTVNALVGVTLFLHWYLRKGVTQRRLVNPGQPAEMARIVHDIALVCNNHDLPPLGVTATYKNYPTTG